jgi:hypothetical protein
VPKDETLKLGSIVWANVKDPTNRQFIGEHPAVVLNSQAEIDAGEDFRVAVCTTSFDRPLPPGCFDIASGAGSENETGLPHPTVVKAFWIERITRSSARFEGFRAPMRTVKQVKNWIDDVERKMLRANANQSGS